MWIVDVKIEKGYEDNEGGVYLDPIEISAVRENNKLGIESYGWRDNDNKIILFEGDCEPEEGDFPDEKTLDQYKQITKKFCEILNEEEF